MNRAKPAPPATFYKEKPAGVADEWRGNQDSKTHNTTQCICIVFSAKDFLPKSGK